MGPYKRVLTRFTVPAVARLNTVSIHRIRLGSGASGSARLPECEAAVIRSPAELILGTPPVSGRPAEGPRLPSVP